MGSRWPASAAQPAGAAGGAVPARLPLDAVRAGQVRDPAAASARRRTGRRQCAGRGRHLRRHPDRHAGRRPARRVEHGDPVDRRRRLVVAFAGYLTSRGIPSGAAPAPELRSIPTRSPKPGATSPSPARTARFPVHPRHLVVLALRRAVPGPVPGLRQGRAGRRRIGTVTLLLAIFTVGIGIGSLLCERLSGGHVEIGLVPFGSIGLTCSGWTWPSPRRSACRPAPHAARAARSPASGACCSTC
jgi:hypothetical protein